MQRAAIGTILPNPSNPRIIKDDKFKKLVKSIQEFPEMLELRPIVVDGNMVVLGGNMRLKACISAGLKDIPIIIADQLTDAQKGEFIIKDNVGFGEWDWDLLANEWEPDALIDWGLDLPILMDEPSYDELIGDEKGNPATMKITFDSPEQLQKAEIDIQELLDRKYQGSYFSVSAGGI
jgi:ParB-like chromosome segregation protein Spo0J